jgi:predicted outer membrane repeat protein
MKMKKVLLSILLPTLNLVGFSGIVTVTNINDAGGGSLRNAVATAISGDTITFSPALISGGNDTIKLTTGEIAFGKDLNIIGLITALDTLFVSGNNISRIFNITGGTTTLDKMAIINGYAVTGAGGGINTVSTYLNIKNCLIRGNSVSSNSYGGGISVSSSSLEINNSVINGNSSNQGGGVLSWASDLTISNSTISDNTASVSGGGIYSASTPLSNLSITNSTISDNTASVNGGGIYASSYLTIVNSTISSNTASSGSGVYFASTSYTFTIGSSIIALNTGSSNIYGSFSTNNGYNVFGDSPTGYNGNDQINVSGSVLNLGSLQSNGGNTFTMMPGVGSVTIDMGNPVDATNAQNGTIIGRRDVGAAEYNLSTVNIYEIKDVGLVSFYPNPTSGDVYIKSSLTIKEVVVYDYSGAQKISYDTNQKINLSSLSKGTYVIKLIDENNNQYYKKVVLLN